MSEIQDRIAASSIGIRAQVEDDGVVPRTPSGRVDLRALVDAFEGTPWIDVFTAIYDTGYYEGEANREDDVITAVTHARTHDELMTRLRLLTDDEGLQLGSEWS